MLKVVSLFAIAVMCLGVPSCAWWQKNGPAITADGKQIAIDCLNKAVSDQVPSVVGQINAILVDAAKSSDAKQVAIDNLQVTSVAVLACAAREAFEDLVRAHMFDEANPEIVANRDTMRSYLSIKDYRFVDGYSVSADAGSL